MGSLDGRVALVTGASRGIGAAIARRLAAEGASVAAVARTLTGAAETGSLADTVAGIEAAGGTAMPVQADLSRPDERDRAVDVIVENLGPVDILVNDAAVTFLGPLGEISDKRYRLMFEVQVHGPAHLCQRVLPGMCERGAGWILNISSRAAIHPAGPPYGTLARRGFAVYGMCKAALERMTTGLAAEVSHLGVRVNALAPWDNVATPGTAHHDLLDYPLEDPALMAEAALLLCSADITGQIAYSAPLLAEHERRVG
jgi:citronellol/citronellal dehydrogenase